MFKTLQATQIALDASDAVRTAKIAHLNAKANVRKTLGEEHPLSSFVGKEFTYTRAMWGSPRKGVFGEDDLKYYDYMEPLMLEKGSSANEAQRELGLEDDAIYACYVCLEQDSSWDNEFPEYWEYLFVKVS